MQVEVFTLSNINFPAHHQKTSPLWNKTQEGLVQADLRSYCQKAVWTCPGQVWPPLLEDTILQHRPRAFWLPSTPTYPSAMPQGVQHPSSNPCYENTSLEGVTLSSCYRRYFEVTVLTRGTTAASLWPCDETQGQEWCWVDVALQLFGEWGPRRVDTAPLHRLAWPLCRWT